MTINWQPIETAPKDGTEILVFYEKACVEFIHIARYAEYKDEQYEDGSWHYPFEDEWKSQGFPSKEAATGWWSFVENSVAEHKLCGFDEPTHWAELNYPDRA